MKKRVGKIIDLETYRSDKKSLVCQNAYQDYLLLLSDLDLLQESSFLISNLMDQSLGNDHISRAKLIIREVNKRVGEDSPQLSQSIDMMTHRLEKIPVSKEV